MATVARVAAHETPDPPPRSLLLGRGLLFDYPKGSALQRFRPLDGDRAVRFGVAQVHAERSHRHRCDADDDVASSLIGDEIPDTHGRRERARPPLTPAL
jgi:hypothetical protein